MSVPSFRKPAFAATGCCFLLILGASLCMAQFLSGFAPVYPGYEHAHSVRHGLHNEPVLNIFFTTKNQQQPSYFENDQQSRLYSKENLAQQSSALGNSQQEQHKVFPQNGIPPRSPVTTGPVNGQDNRSQTSFIVPQSGQPGQNGASPPNQVTSKPANILDNWQQSSVNNPPAGLPGQNGAPPRSLGTGGPSNVQGNLRQTPVTNPQLRQPGQNGGNFRDRVPSAQYKAQENPRQPDGSIYFPGMDYSQRGSESPQSTTGALDFAFSMLKAHVLPQQANSAICPILPQMLLASLYDVADQDAKSQLQAALQASSKELQLALNQQLLATNQSAANQLDYASTFFIGSDTKINPLFSNRAAQEGVTFQQVDFRNPNAAASVANKWVTDKTRGIIREIVSSANLDPATRLMMASVIYFKGQWKFQFTKTEPGIFEPTPQTSKQVQMMYQYNKFRYGEIDFKSGNGLHWVDLPYEGSSELSMVLVLPKVRHQLQNSLQEMTSNDMKEIMNEVTERQRGTNKVHLSVPRFGVFSSTSLVPALKSLGLTAIFDRSTALTSLANEELVVRDVSQRTYIAVDEKGTTATSVASLSFVALSAAPPPPTINFTLNEPFLAMIVDKKNGYPMFVAKVLTPEEIQN